MAKPLAYLMPVCAIAIAFGAGSGCARVVARATPSLPPLDMPAPPPRVIEPSDADPPTPGALVDAPASGAPSARRPPVRVEAPKPDPPKPEPTAPAEPPAVLPEPPRSAPATTLQTIPPGREAALEKEIRDLLARAASNLNRVDYQRLNSDAKAQYDQAKRFATQADDSLRARNLVFAQNLAEKASNLATQLAGR